VSTNNHRVRFVAEAKCCRDELHKTAHSSLMCDSVTSVITGYKPLHYNSLAERTQKWWLVATY